MTVTMFGYLILISIDFVFFLVLVSIDKFYQTLKTVFDHISKDLELREKYSTARRIFNSPAVFENVVKHGVSCFKYYV